MKIAIGSDERTHLTDKVIEGLKTSGHEVLAFGSLLENESEVDWPLSCSKVAFAVANNKKVLFFAGLVQEHLLLPIKFQRYARLYVMMQKLLVAPVFGRARMFSS